MSPLFGCLCVLQAFELATGDYLFDPQSGATFTREEGLCSLRRLLSLIKLDLIIMQSLSKQITSPTS